MWTRVEDALQKYHTHKVKILADGFSLPWRPIMKEEAQKFLFQLYKKPLQEVQVNTPSPGQYWSTHPTYRYMGGQYVFIKCSDLKNILNEFEMLNLMKKCDIAVPTTIGVYDTPQDIFEEDKKMAPFVQRGAILVEEFLHSICLGHALIERRIDMAILSQMVIDNLAWLHKFGSHNDLKHQHIRICLESELAHKFIYEPPHCDLVAKINRVKFIDVESFELFDRQDELVQRERISQDLTYLHRSLIDYLKNVFNLPEEARNSLTMLSKDQIVERFAYFQAEMNRHFNLELVEQALFVKQRILKYGHKL